MKHCIIIGAGILGASAAYRLAKLGAKVTVIDKKHEGQATDAAAGIVCPWLSQRRNKAWYALAKGGARCYPDLIAELEADGEHDTGYARVGALSLHSDRKKLEAMEKRALLRKEEAPEIGEVKLLAPEEARAIFPLLADGYGAVHVTGAGRVDGRALRDSLLRAAKKHGAEIIYGEARLLQTGKRVTGATAGGEIFEADVVLVAGGAWAGQLLSPLDLGVRFQKAQIIHLRLDAMETGNWPVIMPPSDQYLVPFAGGRIVAGATHENDTGFDSSVTAGGLQEVLNKALSSAPGLSAASFVEARVGFRPFTPGFLPVFGPVPGLEGIMFANGLGASGLTMGPFIGTQIAKLILGLETDLPFADYAVTISSER